MSEKKISVPCPGKQNDGGEKLCLLPLRQDAGHATPCANFSEWPVRS